MNKAAIPLIIFLLMAGLFLFVLQKINTGEYDPRDVPRNLLIRRCLNLTWLTCWIPMTPLSLPITWASRGY